ncbi:MULTISPECIES: glycosyltransferase family 4 protein [unclassified Streptomyces]|uniref:glycosyltransferase family 4 protein n=1 Tax=unclassified Streptomyces TaxID=2593676 RepID=UPI000DC77221|nr:MULTISPECIES: glycosyltransferase family 4 protein [unclassified Streptomyces]AWZ03557.1 glycosyltransferase [Streptomyces sp. ICC4]AWZ12584.1 glycosyltransferase [Streptomyces sp. ICC1]
MSRHRILTGIDLPLEPSCGSTIWCNDTYPRLSDRFHTTFAALPGSGTWKHRFEETVPLASQKAPYGPGFERYADSLTSEVAQLLTRAEPDLIHAQHLGFGLALAFARAAGAIPLISIAHGTDIIVATEIGQARTVLHEIVAASTAVAVPNQAMADQVNTLTGNLYADRLVTVPWGIPLPAAPTTEPTTGSVLRLLHAGRLDDNKSTITAIDALAATREPHHLTVIGSGPELPALQARVQHHGLAHRVTFEPFAPRADLWARFRAFDAFVFTTRTLEAYGLVAIEAQAHGLPILYSDVPGLGATLGHGGLSYPPGDSHALAAVIDCVAANPHLRPILRQSAADNSRQHDIAATADRLGALSDTVIGATRA